MSEIDKVTIKQSKSGTAEPPRRARPRSSIIECNSEVGASYKASNDVLEEEKTMKTEWMRGGGEGGGEMPF